LIELLKVDDEITLTELKATIGKNISNSTISRIIKRHNYKSKFTRYCQFVSVKNQHKRFAYSLLSCYFGDNFDNMIFTDETTVKIEVQRENGLVNMIKKMGKNQASNISMF
jgi:hypothetical protein